MPSYGHTALVNHKEADAVHCSSYYEPLYAEKE